MPPSTSGIGCGGLVGRGERGGRTVKPVNGGDVPAGVVILSVLGPASAVDGTVTNSESEVAVPPGPIMAVTPPPLKTAAVAPLRFVPVTAIIKTLPGAAVLGVIAVIAGVEDITVELTVTVCEVETPPPGEGFVTLIASAVGTARLELGRYASSVVDDRYVVTSRESP